MDRLQSAALIVELVDQLHQKGSWCGETHLQKAAYFLQELLNVPLGFEFVLYKHGPFSFSFRDKLTELRADGLLDLSPRPYPYGPTFSVTKLGEAIRQRYPKTLGRYGRSVAFVAERLGNKGVANLEKLATALYVTRESPEKPRHEQAVLINELKPHVSVAEATQALAELAAIEADLAALR